MNETTRAGRADQELSAIGTILRALDGLDGESIQRVLDYVFSRLSIGRPSSISSVGSIVIPEPPLVVGGSVSPARQPSIRDVKEEKQPESSNQMAALVAYYLAEVVPEGERRPAINTADVEKYFKQARYNLPKKPGMTLPNAAAAGYFDSIGNGLYKLNPVGYNLVAHGLPRGASSLGPTRKRAPKKKSQR